jgi:hypothetical protein
MATSTAANAIIETNTAKMKALIAGLVAGGATPTQIFHAGARFGIFHAGYEAGVAEAALQNAPSSASAT